MHRNFWFPLGFAHLSKIVSKFLGDFVAFLSFLCIIVERLTKIPESVKKKIEGLFKKARDDISCADELKKELDHWSIYKEYEDRFLDLFKKSDNKNS